MNTELNKLHQEKISRNNKKKKINISNDITNKISDVNLLKDNIKNKQDSENSSNKESDIIIKHEKEPNDTIKDKQDSENSSNKESNVIIKDVEDSSIILDNMVDKVIEERKIINNSKNKIENNDIVKRCRICYEEDESLSDFLFPCKCNGSIKWVHEKCIKEWITISGKNYCPQCKYTYVVKKTCNYPRLSFLSKKRNIRFVSLFIMTLLVLVIGLLKYLIIGVKSNSKIRFFLDGLKGLIIISLITIPILYYKKWIDINSIYTEMYGNTVLMGSSIGDISGFIFLVINDITNKLIKKYIKFEDKIQNYTELL